MIRLNCSNMKFCKFLRECRECMNKQCKRCEVEEDEMVLVDARSVEVMLPLPNNLQERQGCRLEVVSFSGRDISSEA